MRALPPAPTIGAAIRGRRLMAMDERQLTAWLITHGVLDPGQGKGTLEEQLRLEREGDKLDVLEVARRLGHLTDVQLLEVLEQTGYTPAARVAAPRERVSLQAPAPGAAKPGGVPAVPRDLVPPHLRGAAAPAGPPSDESQLAPVELGEGLSDEGPIEPDEADEAEVTASGKRRLGKTSSGARRRLGTSSASYAAARRKGDGGVGLLIGGGGALLGLLAIALFLPGGGGPGPVDTGSNPGAVSVGPSPSEVQALLQELQDDVVALQERGGRLSRGERTRIVGLIARLERERLVVSQTQALARIKDRLRSLTGEGKTGAGAEAGGGESRSKATPEQIEAAWQRLGDGLERVIWLCLQQPRSPFQLAAEAARGKDLRRQIAAAIKEHAAQGPEGIVSLAGDVELHPILGVGGYDALLREIDRFPEDVRETERGKRITAYRARFEDLRARASAYTRGLLVVEEAADRGDMDAARLAFSGGSYADDPWFRAVREVLARPDVAQAFARRAAAVAEGRPAASGAPTPTGTTGRVTAWGQDWRERFQALGREHRRAKDAERAELEARLKGVVEETLALSRESFEGCAEVVAFYDERDPRRVIDAAPSVQPLIKEIHALYFDAAFAAATGPGTLRELDAWCAGYRYDAWRARLKPYLRLVAAAGSPQARARERAREGRGQARAAVAAFSDQRLSSVAEGLGEVLSWMRKRGYAPAAAKQELDDLIARAIERAGDPVTGARLREELGAIEHDAEQADEGSGLAKAFHQQVKGVVDEAVDRSLKAVEKCIAAGEPGLAFDLFTYVLLLDPENDRAHKGLGHVKVDGTWLRRFEAERLRAGYAWDSELGWISVADRARYAKGEYFDLQTKQWTTVAEANRRHAELASCWEVRTEHFLLKSTADLPETTRVAERLEAFYLQLFRQYDVFFGGKGAALIFGVAPSQSQPLVVNYYRTRDQFKQHANPPTEWAAGFYSGGQHASFFYSSRDWTTLQHEIVHQILGESSPGHAVSWLAEGAAVYLEDAFFRDGVLTLGGLSDHSRVVAYQNNLRGGGQEHSLTDMLRFRTGQDWDSGDISKNYRGAGAVVYFLCTFDGGRYRSDFVEYLRAAYQGQDPKLEDYFGLPAEVLNALMRRFYDPQAKVELPGGGSASAADLAAAQQAMVDTCGARDPDLDQLTEAYALLRKALPGAAQKEADKARDRAGKALASLRKKAASRVEKAIKKSVDAASYRARWERLEQLRTAALAVINDPGVYPDENHGAVGQPTVDAKVNELEAFWTSLPPVFEEPEVAKDLELLEATAPWLDELEVDERRRGKTVDDLREELNKRAGCPYMAPTPEASRLAELNAKVLAHNANLPGVSEDGREQVRILNEYRIMLGLHALAIDPRLVECAAKHSRWMEQAGNMTHDEPDPARATPQKRAGLEGYNDPVGENVAFGMSTPLGAHKAWYTSSGHHRNMIHKGFHQVGVARSGTYWTQVFGAGKPNLP